MSLTYFSLSQEKKKTKKKIPNVLPNVPNLLPISRKKSNNKKISIINKFCKFLSVSGTKPSLINVKKVTIPMKIHRNEDKIIQLKFLIILNILINH